MSIRGQLNACQSMCDGRADNTLVRWIKAFFVIKVLRKTSFFPPIGANRRIKVVFRFLWAGWTPGTVGFYRHASVGAARHTHGEQPLQQVVYPDCQNKILL